MTTAPTIPPKFAKQLIRAIAPANPARLRNIGGTVQNIGRANADADLDPGDGDQRPGRRGVEAHADKPDRTQAYQSDQRPALVLNAVGGIAADHHRDDAEYLGDGDGPPDQKIA